MTRPLTVCMVHYSDYHIDSRIQRQARALAERGDHVHLVCLSPAGEERVGDGVIHLHNVPAGDKASGGPRAYVMGYAKFLARALWRVAAIDRREKLDLVEAHNMPDALTLTGLVPRLRGTPVILNVHDTFPELFATKYGLPADHAVERVIRVEERISAAFSDHVIVVTELARDTLAARGIGRDGCTVVMNSPDTAMFGPQRTPVELPEDGPIRVLYHGGSAPRFGVDVLIRAVAQLGSRLPRLELRVCGAGEDRARLAELAASLAPDRISVAPEAVPFREIPGELEAAHIGVVPTLEDRFTELLLPVKLMEYVHMGLPVVASRLPGIASAFGDDALLTFEPGSVDDLSAALVATCADPATAQARALRASEQQREISWAAQRERYLALVDRLTERGVARSGAEVASAVA
ncbi:MAG TPA: glycosyltransferase family 4 protein [Baekduia sp.]